METTIKVQNDKMGDLEKSLEKLRIDKNEFIGSAIQIGHGNAELEGILEVKEREIQRVQRKLHSIDERLRECVTDCSQYRMQLNIMRDELSSQITISTDFEEQMSEATLEIRQQKPLLEEYRTTARNLQSDLRQKSEVLEEIC